MRETGGEDTLSREVNVADAKSWTKEELASNYQYLRDRGRDAEADELKPMLPSDAEAADAADEGTLAGTVDEVKAAVAEMDNLDELSAMLEQEEAGKERKGVIEAIEARMEELEA